MAIDEPQVQVSHIDRVVELARLSNRPVGSPIGLSCWVGLGAILFDFPIISLIGILSR